MTFDDLVQRVLQLCPDAEICRDNEGQIVVYTGMKEDGRRLVPMAGEPVLSIGITHDNEGFSASSVSVASSNYLTRADRVAVANSLKGEFGVEFDEFIVVSGDEVIDHWREGGE